MDFSITRDGHGVPHVRGETAADAWAGMGYACAEDRLFQLDYDRRRACGRWAEIAGAGAVGGDVLARRLGLAAAAQRDVAAMSATARAAFEAYAGGVNAAIADGALPLPGRYRVEPWRGVALGRRVPGAARADGAVAAQAGQRGAAGAGRADGLRAARDPPAARVAARGAAGRAALGTGVAAARRRAGRCRRAPGVPGRGRAGVERVGGQRAPDRPRRGGDLQRLAPGARHAERVLAVPGVVPGLRRDGGDVPRAAGVPALRLQRLGRVGDHPRGRRLAGPLPGTVLRRSVPDRGPGGRRPSCGRSGSRCAAGRR